MNEIEMQFFEAFEIEPFIYCSKPILDCDARSKSFCRKNCEYYSGVLYPQITDRILLKLICLMGNTDYFLITNWGTPINIDGLKDSVLHSLTIYSKFHKGLKEEVQAIFKEQ